MATSTSKVVESMRKRNVEGHIFNINRYTRGNGELTTRSIMNFSVLGHELRDSFLSDIDGLNGFNVYPACKHASVALTHTVRRELKSVGAPIRITVRDFFILVSMNKGESISSTEYQSWIV